ncbi:MAG: PLDc N-terminal domain-containing protein [Candidatus Omnitrophica bacterium]|nr:PLDc N-terminal domain-containing protein [Candidatus Omnitrophota bacterium]
MNLELVAGLPLIAVLVIVAIWLWIFYDILFVSTISSSQKVFWILIVLIFNIVGLIFYLLLGRKESDYEIVKR